MDDDRSGREARVGATPLDEADQRAETVHARPGALVGAVLLALAFGSLVWVSWRAFVATVPGVRFEHLALIGAPASARAPAADWLEMISIAGAIAFGIAIIATVAVRRSWVLFFQAAFVVAASSGLAQLLKRVVFTRDLVVLSIPSHPNSLPSGHTAVAASVALALVLVVPRRARPLTTLLGFVYSLGIGLGTLVAEWHRPSDVVAAYLLAGACALIALAAGGARGVDAPDEWRRSDAVSATVGCGLTLAVVCSAAAAWGAYRVWPSLGAGGRAAGTAAFVTGCLAVIAAGLLVFSTVLGLRQATARPAGFLPSESDRAADLLEF